jgi:anthranilate/para-aminobenzoate synthase component II
MGTMNTFALTIRNAVTVAVLILGASLGFAGTAHAHGTHVAPPPTPQVGHHHGPFSVLHQGPFSGLEGPFSVLGQVRP